MPYTVSHRTRIYYEVEGEGPPLLLHHGLASSLQFWRYAGYTQALGAGAWRDLGYTDALRPGFRLVLLDARGHGRSDKPYLADAYRIETMAADVLAVMDAVGLPWVHYWGYSLGAAVGFALAASARDRFASFILGGYSPFGVRSEPERKRCDWFSQLMATANTFGMQIYLEVLAKQAPRTSPALRAEVLANDPRALMTMTKAIYRWQGVGQVLPSLAAPCLLYAGEADPWCPSLREAARLIPQAEFVTLPGHDDLTAPLEGEAILDQARRFLLARTVRQTTP